MVWRVVRTTVRGQFANDDCFVKWVGSNPAQVAIGKVIEQPEIGNPGGPNDRRLYLLFQAAAVPMPSCPNGNPELVTSGGKNGWETQTEAQQVADGDVAQTKAIAAQVAKQNAAAVSPENIAAGAAKDLAGDVGKAGDSILKSPITWIAAAVFGAFAAYKLFK